MTAPSEAPGDVERAFETWTDERGWTKDGAIVVNVGLGLASLAFHAGSDFGFAASAAERKRLEGALAEIAKGEGPFSRDPLKHAENTIGAMKELARAALSSGQGGHAPPPADLRLTQPELADPREEPER